MEAIAWLLTFCVYGSWLPGDARGYIRRTRDGGTCQAPPRAGLEAWSATQLTRAPQTLDPASRAIVDAAIREQCQRAGWALHAVHVRTNHVHVVLSGSATPERMMDALKARATFRLRKARLLADDTGPWARHGSTVPLRSSEQIERACRYVVEGQGATL